MESFLILILSVLLSTGISTGIIGYIIRLRVKHTLDKKIVKIKQENEKELALLKRDVDYLMQVREKGNNATQQVLSIMAQSRRICRYIVALIGCYYSPKTYREWGGYLEVGDDQLEFKKIHEKVQRKVEELMYYRNQLRALMDDNSVWISSEIYKFFHDTFHLYHRFASISERLICATTDNACSRNINYLTEMDNAYRQIDNSYLKIQKTVNKKMEDLEKKVRG